MQQAAPELKRTFLDFVDQKGYFGQIKAMLSRKPPDQRLVLSLDDLRQSFTEDELGVIKRGNRLSILPVIGASAERLLELLGPATP